jgi:hypothetical protein
LTILPPCRLGKGEAVEINFAVKKFKLLDIEAQRFIYRGLQCEPSAEKDSGYGAAALSILELIADAPRSELTRFANEHLADGQQVFTLYLIQPRDYVGKARLFAKYFHDNLGDKSSGFAIEPIDLDSFVPQAH